MLAAQANVAAAADRVGFTACFGNVAGDCAHYRARLAGRHQNIAAAGLDHVAPFGAADVLQNRFANWTLDRVNALTIARLADRRADRAAAFANVCLADVAADLIRLLAAMRL